MPKASWLQGTSAAFRLMIATSWLAPASWQGKQEEAIREAIGVDLDWMEYIRLVDRHRTPALSRAALNRVPALKIPEPAKQELKKRSEACRMQAVQHSMLLAGMLKGLNQAGIQAMTLKGPILSFDLYGDVGLRQSHDLDLEVAQENLSQALSCLEGLGWRKDSEYFPLSPRQWRSFLRHGRHLGLVHSQGCILELHWRNSWDAPGQTALRWARSIPCAWQGCSYMGMHPVDRVLYLSSHGGDHAWFRAKWLGDLARVHADGQMDWMTVLEHARTTNQEMSLLASLRLLKEVHGLALPDLPERIWQDIPSSLIETPLNALKDAKEPASGALASAKNRLFKIRHDRLILPQKAWRDTLADLVFSLRDFETLRLPDRLFWAYAPLHPFLAIWRFAFREQRNRKLA